MTDQPGNDPLDALLAPRAPRRNSADALDDLIAASGARPRSSDEPVVDRAGMRRRWEIGLSLTLALVAFSGALADTVAASQLISDGGIGAVGIVWPIAGLLMLAVAYFQSGRVDRFARVKVLVWLCAAYAVGFAVVLVLFASSAPTWLPSALAWGLADQMNFLVPLIVWALAGDVFTAGQGVTVFPRMSRWLYGGQGIGLVAAAVTPFVFDTDLSLAWLLVLPPIACVIVAVLVPRSLHDATTSEGHGKEQSSAEALRDTRSFVKELPAFNWLLRASFAAMAAGAVLEISFLSIADDRYESAADLQVLYGGAAVIGFVICWILQTYAATPLLQRLGVGKVLRFLPFATIASAMLMLLGGVFEQIALAMAALIVWRLPRWSIDASARQAAHATIPDERRARVSFLIDLVPVSVGFVIVAIPIGIALATDTLWTAPILAFVLAAAAVVLSKNVVSTWDDTQLSYRLKRRKRLG
ncbi:MAG: hypothetical protein RI958_599 [Actinomycetota bacterium]|jgi:hypothetical protein